MDSECCVFKYGFSLVYPCTLCISTSTEYEYIINHVMPIYGLMGITYIHVAD